MNAGRQGRLCLPIYNVFSEQEKWKTAESVVSLVI